MKKGTENQTEKKISCAAKFFFAILLVCVIAEKILSPSGKFALLDAGLGIFYGLLLRPAFLAVITYFIFHPMTFLSKEEKKPYTIMEGILIGITILWVGFGIWNAKNIVLDCVQEPKTICLEDVTCSLENGYYRNGGSNCYLYGTADTGEQFRFEIADTEAEWVSDLDKVYIPFKAIRIETKEQAQAVPSPCTSYAMFYNGKFLTNEQFNDKKFLKLIQGK